MGNVSAELSFFRVIFFMRAAHIDMGSGVNYFHLGVRGVVRLARSRQHHDFFHTVLLTVPLTTVAQAI